MIFKSPKLLKLLSKGDNVCSKLPNLGWQSRFYFHHSSFYLSMKYCSKNMNLKFVNRFLFYDMTKYLSCKHCHKLQHVFQSSDV